MKTAVKKLIAPSILSADFSRIGEEIAAVEKAGADWIHVDVMDGHFVPNITIGPLVVDAVRKCTKLPLDVHLMIENAPKYIPEFIKAGADYVTFHIETGENHEATCQMIRDLGAKPGIVINPATPVSAIKHLVGLVDLILVMSVNPGFGGQKFMPVALDKIKELKTLVAASGRSVLLEIDGGIKADNIAIAAEAGADVFVAGSAIFGQSDYAGIIKEMRQNIEMSSKS